VIAIARDHDNHPIIPRMNMSSTPARQAVCGGGATDVRRERPAQLVVAQRLPGSFSRQRRTTLASPVRTSARN
jgi:hypothetical protein